MAIPSRAPRKTPVQRRSSLTVDAILEAATRIFSQRGFNGTSTAQVAALAGVSVGSLYQYFPHKLALLAGAKERHLQQLFARLQQALRDSSDLDAGLRAAVRVTIATRLEARELLLVCAQELPARLATEVKPSDSPPALLVRAHLHRHRHALPHHRPELAALVVVELVDAVTRAALHERDAELRNGVLEHELMTAILLYLRGEPAGSGSMAARKRQKAQEGGGGRR